MADDNSVPGLVGSAIQGAERAAPKNLTEEILEALVRSVGDAIFATELAFCQGARRCDFWTISANSSAGFKARAYEIKISRQDFKRDTAIKQREARLFSDQFYYVAPARSEEHTSELQSH